MAELYRIDDNVTSPYLTWARWNNESIAGGTCNSQCTQGDGQATGNHCPCLAYLTPAQIAQLDKESEPQQEVVAVGAGGKFDVVLGPYAAVMVEFHE